jgi:hypothetical protein
VHGGSLELPLLEGDEHPTPTFVPGADHSGESAADVAWEIRDDVLRRTTHARTHVTSRYDTPYDGRAREDYLGEVSVDRRTFEQRAHAETTFELGWPGVDVEVRSVMDLVLDREGLSVDIETRALADGVEISRRTWRESHPS